MKPEVKVISITRQKWFRYAAAAVVIGFIAMGGFLFLTKKETINPVTKSSEWVKQNTKKISTDEINNFVQLADEEAPVTASVDVKTAKEIKDLVKDIPDKDIQDFLDETQTGEPENN